MTDAPAAKRMTNADRGELLSLIRKREKVMRAAAGQRSADLLAEFDAQSAKIYHWDEDATWAQAKKDAEDAVAEAEKIIAARCEALGIPREFAPSLGFAWHGRGHNAVTSRRTELRRAAKSKIEALEAAAIASIEKISLQSQTDLLTQGLETDSAKLFLNSMPNLQTLMPSVQVADMQALLETARRRELNYLN